MDCKPSPARPAEHVFLCARMVSFDLR
ncbi:hypothetical protein JMJ77_0006833 [Colletotrichum scovillei]|uniref:Uncharacterized protein n=1 Tax=Colletotrichum scovillei TaxID=1209932 RepID=A0A9P7UMS0_9PEZI|nr:hypothetical protein JMJ77_0006833 [Colletotrichum scovillei]KAG7078080.1 hypothetical protein JMJ76_0015315 [Colletotrichum scovillei]KAG7085175.1 hypothetical protein JMJ78_0010601 [Colletotrichum scovillei]